MPSFDLETVRQPLLYAGYWYDRELSAPGETTGWYWLSVREYDPQLRRFLQPDPSGIEGARSYVYAGDDPVDLTDPSGLIGEAGGTDPCIIQRGDPGEVYYEYQCWHRHGHVQWRSPYHIPLTAGTVIVSKRPAATDINTADYPGLYAKGSGSSSRAKGAYGEDVTDEFMARFGYKKIGGHPGKPGAKGGGGTDAVYEKVAEVPGNENLPRFILADAFTNYKDSYVTENFILHHAGKLSGIVSPEDYQLIQRDGYILVNSKVTFSGPEEDPGSSADIEITEVHTVMGASGDYPVTDIIGAAEGAPDADE